MTGTTSRAGVVLASHDSRSCTVVETGHKPQPAAVRSSTPHWSPCYNQSLDNADNAISMQYPLTAVRLSVSRKHQGAQMTRLKTLILTPGLRTMRQDAELQQIPIAYVIGLKGIRDPTDDHVVKANSVPLNWGWITVWGNGLGSGPGGVAASCEPTSSGIASQDGLGPIQKCGYSHFSSAVKIKRHPVDHAASAARPISQ